MNVGNFHKNWLIQLTCINLELRNLYSCFKRSAVFQKCNPRGERQSYLIVNICGDYLNKLFLCKTQLEIITHHILRKSPNIFNTKIIMANPKENFFIQIQPQMELFISQKRVISGQKDLISQNQILQTEVMRTWDTQSKRKLFFRLKRFEVKIHLF